MKRHLLSWVLGALVLAGSALMVAGPRLLPTEWVRRLAQTSIADSVRLALQEKVNVSLGQIEWRRWGHIRLADLSITHANTNAPLLSVSEFRLRVSLWDLLAKRLVVRTLVINRPTLTLDKGTFARLKLPGAGPREGTRLEIEDMQIEDAAFAVTEDAKTIFQASHLNLYAKSEQDEPLQYRMKLSVASPVISGEISASGQMVAFAGTDPGLLLEDLSFVSPLLKARAWGKLIFARDGPRLHFRVSTHIPPRELNRVIAPAIHQREDVLKCTLAFASETWITGPLSDITVIGSLDLPEGIVQIGSFSLPLRTRPKDIQYTLRLRENELRITELACATPVGTLRATGSITGLKSEPQIALHLSSKDVDTGVLYQRMCQAAGKHPKGWDVRGMVGGEMTLAAQGGRCELQGVADLENLDVVGMGGLVLKPPRSPWDFRYKLTFDKRTLAIQSGTRFKGDIFLVDVTGRVLTGEPEPTVDISATCDMDVGQAFRRWGRACLDLPEGLAATGHAHTKVTVSGKPSRLDLTWENDAGGVAWTLDGAALKQAGPSAGSAVKVNISNGALTFRQAEFHSEFGRASVAGSISNLDAKPVFALRFASEIALPAVLQLLARQGCRLSPDWQIVGTPRLADLIVEGPADQLKIRCNVDLGGVKASWRGEPVLWEKDPPQFHWAAACDKGAPRLDELVFRSRGAEIVLHRATPDAPTLSGQGLLDLDAFQPMIGAAAVYLATAIRRSSLPPTAKDLMDQIQRDFRVSGTVRFPVLSLQDVEGGVRFTGAADMTPVAIAYRDIVLKSPQDSARFDLDATLKANKATLAGGTLTSAMGVTRASGSVDFAPKEPQFELTVQSSADYQKLISILPLEEVQKDPRLNQALKDCGVDILELVDKFDVAGMLSSEARLKGTLSDVSLEWNADLSAMDLTYSAAFRKPTREFCRVGLKSRLTPRAFTLSSASVQSAHGKVGLEGDIVVSPPTIAGSNVRIAVGNKTYDTSFHLSHLSAGGLWFDSAQVRQGDLTLGFEGPIIWQPEQIRADHVRLLINKDSLTGSLLARDYYGENPEIRIRLCGTGLDLRPILPASQPAAEGAPPPPPPKGSAATWAEPPLKPSPKQPTRLIAFMKRATIDLTVFLGGMDLEFYDASDIKPGVRHYALHDVSLDVDAANGLLRGEVTVGLNGGMVDAIINSDFNGPIPQTQTDASAAALGADDNLRPFLNTVFPNLYVDGSLSAHATSRWQGLAPSDMGATSVGESVVEVNKGHVIGKAAPDYILKIFPGLNLYDYRFDRCRIITKTRGPIADSTMAFYATAFNLFMDGKTHNDTHQVDYLCGVDLVSNMGLDVIRDRIPKFMQNSAKVTIVRYRGLLNDQHAEWFTPKMDTIANTIRYLLPLQSLAVLASQDQTAAEKAEYFRKKVEHVLTLPVSAVKRLSGTAKDEDQPNIIQKAKPPSRQEPTPPGSERPHERPPEK